MTTHTLICSKPACLRVIESTVMYLLVAYLLFTCYLLVVYLLFTCCLLVVYLLLTCCLLVIYLLFTCYLLVVYLLFTCLFVPHLLIQSATSDIMLRSILGQLLPEAMVCFLENYGMCVGVWVGEAFLYTSCTLMRPCNCRCDHVTVDVIM